MSKAQDDDQRLTAERLIDELHEAGLVFFHDQLLEAYVSYDGTGVKISRIESKEFAQWIHRYTYRTHGKVVSADIVKRVVATLTAIAVNDYEQIELGVRLARNGNKVWYDMGKSAVLITKDGWEIINKPPILFKRFNHQLEQVAPVSGGSIQQL